MSFPSTPTVFTPRVDLIDTVLANDVNSLQVEVTATQTALGDTLLNSTYDSTAWSEPTGAHANLAARLNLIERGLKNGVTSAPYLLLTGGQLQSAAGTVTLIVKSATGNSADLLQAKDSSNNNGFRVDSLGVPYVGTNAVVYSGGTTYNNIDSRISALESASAGSLSPFLLAGM